MDSLKNIKAVIFDCDGVMFDSLRANINYYNHMLAHFNLPPMDKNEEAYVHMHTADESIAYIFRKTDILEKALEYRREVDYSPFIKDMIIEPSLKPLLRALRPRFSLAVATNRSNTIGSVLKSNGLEGFFDIVVSSLDVKRPKPHPEGIFKILDFFGIQPAEAIYVGDSLVDYETAKAAGTPFISFRNLHLPSDIHVDSLAEITHLFPPK